MSQGQPAALNPIASKGSEGPKKSAVSWVRVLGGMLLIVVALLLGTLGYAYVVEPARIEVTHLQVAAPIDSPLKLSDLHNRGLGRVERRLLDLLAREQPDLITCTLLDSMTELLEIQSRHFDKKLSSSSRRSDKNGC